MPGSSFKFSKVQPTPPASGVSASLSSGVGVIFEVAGHILGVLWRRLEQPLLRPLVLRGRQINPFRLDAVFWRGRDPRRRRAMSFALLLNCLLIVLMSLPAMFIPGCEDYLLPSGGGENEIMAQKVVVVRKEKKKRYIVNPLSPIRFDVPDIEEMVEKKVTQELAKGTAERYNVGQGQGDGAGYQAGRGSGMVRFIRLQYNGNKWDLNKGKGADENFLLEYGLRTRQRVAKETESRTIRQLDGFRRFRSPPIVYMVGTDGIVVDDAEVATLRRYLVDNHGMLFGDNGGSARWGRDFRSMMRRVLPEVQPQAVPIDDPIFLQPYRLGSVPFVSPHDPPMVLTGWKIQGRWVCLYHPGDLSDAWKDGHSGVGAEMAESAYALGVNVWHYAHRRYSEWLLANNAQQ